MSMFNLLPTEYIKTLEKAYRMRLTIVALWLVFLATVVAIALLLPSYFLSQVKERELTKRAEFVRQSGHSEDLAALEKTIKATKAELALLRKDDEASFVELVKKIISKKTGEISITGFIVRDVSGKRETMLTGTAATRDSLIEFKKALEAAALGKVELPVSSLAKNKDLGFSLSITE